MTTSYGYDGWASLFNFVPLFFFLFFLCYCVVTGWRWSYAGNSPGRISHTPVLGYRPHHATDPPPPSPLLPLLLKSAWLDQIKVNWRDASISCQIPMWNNSDLIGNEVKKKTGAWSKYRRRRVGFGSHGLLRVADGSPTGRQRVSPGSLYGNVEQLHAIRAGNWNQSKIDQTRFVARYGRSADRYVTKDKPTVKLIIANGLELSLLNDLKWISFSVV